jgi:cyanoexosortase B
MYGPLILHWYDGWLRKSISIEHEYFSHGLLGLPYAAYLGWQLGWQRSQTWKPGARGLGRGARQFRALGLMVVVLAGVSYVSGLEELVNVSFPLMLTGICLWLKGRDGLKLMGFPLLFVWLATPTEVPYLIAPLTLPLQRFIAGTVGILLNLLGFSVAVEGIHVFMNGRLVEVAPYCAGLKMLFTSLYVAVMLLHWHDLWRNQRISSLFLGATVVISVAGNIIRNTILTYFHGTGQDAAFAWLHEGWGGDVYSAGTLGLLVLLIHYLERSVQFEMLSLGKQPLQE